MYNELDNNYDYIYDVLSAGGTVWLRINKNGKYTNKLVVEWEITSSGLILYDVEGIDYTFPNGSHNLEENPTPV